MGTGVGTAVGVASDIFNYKNNKKQLEAQNKLLEQEQKSKEEQAIRKSQVYTQERLDTLNNKISSQNALMGANGISSNSASSKAYVKGLEEEAKEDILNNQYLTEASIDSSRNSYEYNKNMNLLNSKKNDFNLVSGVLKQGINLFKD